jgi:hypothetical protein
MEFWHYFVVYDGHLRPFIRRVVATDFAANLNTKKMREHRISVSQNPFKPKAGVAVTQQAEWCGLRE